MSRVSYFQRFSQPENHATNNTLLMLRYFYQSSPFKIERVLAYLLETTQLSIGLTFGQQISGSASVPEALITQKPLRIFIETKRGGDLDSGQIRRHLESIEQHQSGSHGSAGTVLIGLTKEPIADSDRKSLAAEAASKGITFAAVTFSQIVEALRECAASERELSSIVEDYESYLAEEGLLEERNQWLVVFPCGTSLAENVRFGLYYEPPSRPCKRNYRFIGVYHKMTIAYVGTVEAIAVASWHNGDASFTKEAGKLTAEQEDRIRNAVKETPYYDLKSNAHRYYLVDSFVATDAKKASAGGIMGLRYLDLSKIIPAYNPRKDYTSVELAAAMKGTTWE